MKTQRRNLAFALGVLVAFGLACNFSASTANLSGLKLSKDKEAATETSGFGASDTVYAVATVSNAPGAVKVTGRLVFDQVEGEQSGPVPGLEKTLDLPSSGTATYTFTPPPSGWPKGKYKVEAVMLNDQGEKKDEKSAGFSVD